MKDFATQETMEALREMFPGLEEGILLAVVESSDSTEAAIAALLDICGGDPAAQVDETLLVQTQSNLGVSLRAAPAGGQGWWAHLAEPPVPGGIRNQKHACLCIVR